jgi:flagellar hook-associated protein 3 FlgL
MTTNKMLLNLQRNAQIIDKLYNQYTTGKKILTASEDPIIASRALKFRTNIANTEQYRRNVAQGLAWMDIAEGGFTNVNSALSRIRTLCNQAANGTNDLSDRKAIMTEIATIFDSIKSEMNVDYAGRYVFSGYRTDVPATFIETSMARYEITQNFNAADIEKTLAVVKPIKLLSDGSSSNVGVEPEIYQIHRFKLPYNNVENFTEIQLFSADGITPFTTPSIAIVPISIYDPAAYTPPAPVEVAPGPPPTYTYSAHFIEETGEVVFDEATARVMMSAQGGFSVTYEKEGFNKGEPNPMVYFSVTQFIDDEGVPLSTPKTFNMDNQLLRYEFGANTQIQINNLAMNIMTAQMFADFNSLVRFVDSIRISTDSEIRSRLNNDFDNQLSDEQLDEMVALQLTSETQKYRDVLWDRFNNMLKLIDIHASNISKEFTELGSRMNRLDLINERLEQDRVSYTALMSDNENVDYLEVIMRLNSAESVYAASLNAGASIIMLTLADYIRL